jgi:hypothetical protein
VTIDESVRQLIAEGTATIVATRDDRMRPTLTRGWGVVTSADGAEMKLCIGAPKGSPVRESLAANGAIAITCSRPSTYRTVQVKGEVVKVAAPSAEDRAAVEAQIIAFSAEVEALGMPPDSGRALVDAELIAVTLVPRELFDQTPGPSAGARL